jgi:DNA modification methylase
MPKLGSAGNSRPVVNPVTAAGVHRIGKATVHVGDCLRVLSAFKSESVQCCVTSPPYYGLRDYGVEGQIGLEKTPAEYVARMVAVFEQVRRVLRKDGTLWLNLGDSYANTGASGPQGMTGDRATRTYTAAGLGAGRNGLPPGTKPKDLLGIPWQVAFALREAGWYLRQDIIWAKPNPMPESVTDRCTKSHEYVFLMTKSPRYYYDAEAIKESSQSGLVRPRKRPNGLGTDEEKQGDYGATSCGIGQTRNRRSVWNVAPKPFKGAHFAVFPAGLITPCILAGTSERGACPRCGAPWRRRVERTRMVVRPSPRREEMQDGQGDLARTQTGGTTTVPPSSRTVGWDPGCTCPAREPVPCRVLDPFLGSGTTAEAALSLGRSCTGIELSPDYVSGIVLPRLARFAV